MSEQSHPRSSGSPSRFRKDYFETLAQINRDAGGVDGFPPESIPRSTYCIHMDCPICSTTCDTIGGMTNYSGRFNVRLPVGLHEALAEHAEQEGVSLNTAVVALMAGGLGYRTSGDPIRLTKMEADVLMFTATTAGDDLDHMPLSGAEKRAYDRGIKKLRSAR